MTMNAELTREEPRVVHIVVAALPTSLRRVAEWAEIVVAEHPHIAGMRVLVDCSRLPIDRQPPTVKYLARLAAALEPLTRAASRSRCAILVSHGSWLCRARV